MGTNRKDNLTGVFLEKKHRMEILSIIVLVLLPNFSAFGVSSLSVTDVATGKIQIDVAIGGGDNLGVQWKLYLDSLQREIESGPINSSGVLFSTIQSIAQKTSHRVYLVLFDESGKPVDIIIKQLEKSQETALFDKSALSILLGAFVGFLASSLIFLLQEHTKERNRNRRNEYTFRSSIYVSANSIKEWWDMDQRLRSKHFPELPVSLFDEYILASVVSDDQVKHDLLNDIYRLHQIHSDWLNGNEKPIDLEFLNSVIES